MRSANRSRRDHATMMMKTMIIIITIVAIASLYRRFIARRSVFLVVRRTESHTPSRPANETTAAAAASATGRVRRVKINNVVCRTREPREKTGDRGPRVVAHRVLCAQTRKLFENERGTTPRRFRARTTRTFGAESKTSVYGVYSVYTSSTQSRLSNTAHRFVRCTPPFRSRRVFN